MLSHSLSIVASYLYLTPLCRFPATTCLHNNLLSEISQPFSPFPVSSKLIRFWFCSVFFSRSLESADDDDSVYLAGNHTTWDCKCFESESSGTEILPRSLSFQQILWFSSL
ncbi:hypothetical protein Lal_00045414 [Lupinus albus]|nr:hypothetical protein Lal_00045414 [Lupinus albus]